MKKLGYRMIALIYNVTQAVSKQKNTIIFLNGQSHGLQGNLLEMYEAYQQLGGYRLFCYSKADLLHGAGRTPHSALDKIKGLWKFFVVLPWKMATAKKVFLNDNFIPMAYIKKNPNKQWIQLWHGCGAFKRFGLSTEQDPQVCSLVKQANERITHLFISSTQVLPFYEEAFGMSSDKIYVTGLPVTDVYFQQESLAGMREQVYDKYPVLRRKKVLLFTPTFRATDEENQQILSRFDVERIHEVLGEEWMILVKMHPKFPSQNMPKQEYCLDMTSYPDITQLYTVADCLVSDYSSTVVEYVLLDKPIIMFAYDLEKYDRGFYRDYQETVPGRIAKNTDELCEILADEDQSSERRKAFIRLQYDYTTKGATKRILDILEG